MPNHAPRHTQTMVGISAGSASLQHLLNVIFDPRADRDRLVEAIETEPAVFLQLLPNDPLERIERWHQGMSTPLLKTLALGVALIIDIDAANASLAAQRESLLAGELARLMSGGRPAETRLAALLTHPLVLLGQDASEHPGLPPLAGDAKQYRDEPVARLAGAPPLIRAVNVAARLTTDSAPSNELIASAAQLLETTPGRIDEARSAANWQYEQLARKLDFSPFDRRDAIRATVLSRIGDDNDTGEESISAVANHFLGARAALVFRRDGGTIGTVIDAEPLEIELDADNSVIARCIRTGSAESGDGDLSHFVERQLCSRFPETQLVALPAGDAGAIALLLPVDQPAPSMLLNALTDVSSALLANADSAATLPVDTVRSQARELIHEVSNPLSIVQNYLRSLSIKLGEDHALQEELDSIGRELSRASTLIARFRHLGEDQPMVLAETNLNQLLTDAANLISETHDAIQINYRLDSQIPRMALPADALRQIASNLLKNAAEALVDTPEPEITISTQGAVNVGGRHFMEVEISDNGPGMNTAERLSIFEMGQSSKGEGRGLGLGIVSKLVNDLDGVISCRENVSGAGGTTFQLLLPFEFNEQDFSMRQQQ